MDYRWKQFYNSDLRYKKICPRLEKRTPVIYIQNKLNFPQGDSMFHNFHAA